MSLNEAADHRVPASSRAPAGFLAGVRARLHASAGETGSAALFAFAVRVASAGIAYLSQALLARWMGSYEYGIYVFVWVWVLILGGLSPLGLSTASMRFVPEYREKGQTGLLRGLLAGSRFIALGVSTVLMLAGFAALHLFGDLLDSHYLLPAFLILFCLPLYALTDVQDGIARGFGWMSAALLPPYILRPLLILAAMFAATLFGFEPIAATAAGAAVFACWAAVLVQFLMLRLGISRNVATATAQLDLRHWLFVSAPILTVNGFDLLLQNTDILVLSLYVAPDDVAIYFAALKTMALVSFVHFAVGSAAANHFSALKARGDADGLADAIARAARWTFWPSLAGAAMLLALGKPLLWLFGHDFASGYPLMFVLAAGFVVRAAFGPALFALSMLGEQNRCALVLLGAALANVALNFGLIPLFGLYGAAAATAISLSGSALAMGLVARHRLGLDLAVWNAGRAK
ncbi:MAG: lipopolysaccharide biosynthesis protein [Pseudomonadota bacterium]|nr:lipopolysaccharide biosynthesis protein [Pseudomonadota bacterium]